MESHPQAAEAGHEGEAAGQQLTCSTELGSLWGPQWVPLSPPLWPEASGGPGPWDSRQIPLHISYLS